MKWIRRNPKYSIPAALVVLGGLAWLAFGFFAVHLLWVDDRVDEAVPVFAAPAVESTTPLETGPPRTTSQTVPVESPQTTTAPAISTPVPSTQAEQPEIVVEHSGSFVSRNHATSGTATVLGNGTGQRFLRFESFATENGPDLNVYLVNSSAGGVEDFVDLGDLKGNIGDQNYAIPADADLGVYDTVLIWCVRFSSAFGEAELNPSS